MPSNSWFAAARAESDDKRADVSIRGYIGDFGVNDRDFIAAIDSLGEVSEILVRINSRGGEVDHALSIFNYLRNHPAKIVTRIEGAALSAASIVTLAGDEIVMLSNTILMIHNPWTLAAGNAAELRKVADDLDAWESALRSTYVSRTGKSENDIKAMLDTETYMTAATALEHGFIDRVEQVTRRAGMAKAFACALSIPDEIIAEIGETEGRESETESPETGTEAPATGAPDPAPDPAQAVAKAAARITQACLKAGIPEIAEVLIMNTPLTDEAAVAAEVERVQAIRDLCLTAKLPELASDYVKSGLSADSVRARLFDKIVQASGKEIDNKEPAEWDKEPKAKVKAPNPSAIYAARKSKVSGKASQTKPSKGAEQ